MSALITVETKELHHAASADHVPHGDTLCTAAILCMSLLVEFIKGSAVGAVLIVLSAIVFPHVYVTTDFYRSDCVNKDEILADEMDSLDVMRFSDSSGEWSCTVGDFMSRSYANAKFYLCLIALFIAMVI